MDSPSDWALPTLLGGSAAIHKLHDRTNPEYVEPSKCCISLEDLDYLAEQVRNLCAEGKIQADQNNLSNEPSIYQVNELYVKPTTKAAGGMSWALMRHPQGLRCDAVAVHSWNQGFFEFIEELRRLWPGDAEHLFLYFLGCPQIGGSSETSPQEVDFTSVLGAARYMLVASDVRETFNIELRTSNYELPIMCEVDRAMQKASEDPSFDIKVSSGPITLRMALLAATAAFSPLFGGFLCSGFWVLPLGTLSWALLTIGACEMIDSLLVCLASFSYMSNGSSEIVILLSRYVDLFFVGLGCGQSTLDFSKLGETGACAALLAPRVVIGIHKFLFALRHSNRINTRGQLENVLPSTTQRVSKKDSTGTLPALGSRTDELRERVHELLVLGRYNKGLHETRISGMPLLLAWTVNPLRFVHAAAAPAAWALWFLAGLETPLGLGLTLIVLCACSSLMLKVTWRLGETSTFAIYTCYLFGIIFSVLESRYDTSMASHMESTLLLLVVCMTSWLIASVCFYTGLRLIIRCVNNSDHEHAQLMPHV